MAHPQNRRPRLQRPLHRRHVGLGGHVDPPKHKELALALEQELLPVPRLAAALSKAALVHFVEERRQEHCRQRTSRMPSLHYSYPLQRLPPQQWLRRLQLLIQAELNLRVSKVSHWLAPRLLIELALEMMQSLVFPEGV